MLKGIEVTAAETIELVQKIPCLMTAVKYLDEMVRLELLKKERIWRRNYYINAGLVAILAHTDVEEIDSAELVRTAEMG